MDDKVTGRYGDKSINKDDLKSKFYAAIRSNGFPESEDMNNLYNALNMYQNREIPESIPSLQNLYVYEIRSLFISNVGFCLVAYDWVRELAKILKGKKCLEIMAGTGALSKALHDCDIDIITTDSFRNQDIDCSPYEGWREHYTEIEKLTAMEAVEKYVKDIDFIVCSWPPYDDPVFTLALNRAYELNPNFKLIYIWEGINGCTADITFFEQYDESVEHFEMVRPINKLYKRWHGIYDRIYIMEKKK